VKSLTSYLSPNKSTVDRVPEQKRPSSISPSNKTRERMNNRMSQLEDDDADEADTDVEDDQALARRLRKDHEEQEDWRSWRTASPEEPAESETKKVLYIAASSPTQLSSSSISVFTLPLLQPEPIEILDSDEENEATGSIGLWTFLFQLRLSNYQFCFLLFACRESRSPRSV